MTQGHRNIQAAFQINVLQKMTSPMNNKSRSLQTILILTDLLFIYLFFVSLTAISERHTVLPRTGHEGPEGE